MKDEYIATIILQDLPEECNSMVMAMKKSVAEITSNFAKIKLIQDIKYSLIS